MTQQILRWVSVVLIVLLSAGTGNVSLSAANGASPSDVEQVTSSEALTDVAEKITPNLSPH